MEVARFIRKEPTDQSDTFLIRLFELYHQQWSRLYGVKVKEQDYEENVAEFVH